jgi:hypothetical protein
MQPKLIYMLQDLYTEKYSTNFWYQITVAK